MNVLILAELIAKSGVGNYIRELSDELAKNGHNVLVVSPTNDLNIGASGNVRYFRINKINKNIFTFLKNVKLLHKIIKENNIDVVHSNHRMCNFLMKIHNLIYKKTPMVWTCHTAPYPNNFVKKILSYYGSKTIAISPECYDFCKNELKIKEENISFILNGVNDKNLTTLNENEKDILFKKYEVDSSTVIVAIHGRINIVKGHDVLLNALELLPEIILNKITVVCSGEVVETDEYYKLILEKIKILSKKGLTWKFIGWTSARDILGISDLFVQPSRREGFPLACIESFFMKVPVIRTKVGGYEVMKEECVGIDVDNPQELSERIIHFIDNKDLYSKMTEKAYSFAKDNCTISNMCKETIKTYIDVSRR